MIKVRSGGHRADSDSRREFSGAICVKFDKNHVRIEKPVVYPFNPHVRIAENHVKFINPHVRIGNPHVKFVNPHVKFGDPHVKFGNPHVKIAETYDRFLNPHVKIDKLYVKFPELYACFVKTGNRIGKTGSVFRKLNFIFDPINKR